MNTRSLKTAAALQEPAAWQRLLDSDFVYAFRRSRTALASALVLLLLAALAVLAPWIAPQNPFDPAALDLLNARLPPAWIEAGRMQFPFGTDGQGRDLLSVLMYGLRISLMVSVCATLFALFVGVTLGLVSGYAGGTIDNLIMRLADMQLSFPAILVALLVDGLARTLLPHALHERLALPVVIFAIGVSTWVQYARTVRGATLVEKSKDYVHAARLIGMGPLRILLRHVLPNVLGPVLVIATLSLGLGILTEATLSFLGLGVPPTSPSLGTLMRSGNEVLFAGEWWVTVLPGLCLMLLVLAINLLGDWLRDVLNPRLR
ncbi:ABC transporter permease [Verminephrobacter aporrectodeae]|uniref:ABC transporter permease n=1 Tax=Verminephrobacter aporrectodeae TaxID=1110389 RepID=UPI002238B83A|nr:ABC transporter permease [Verminephrobacter aporrectodeae]MCW5254960.1 ABC transporter permease [Verminephrobacter aporrectodeae subsp. tuberculatae]MCW8176502.1 ABC transporter permease [Verminephrobacter aporrectodeae subsp. tuberculatae]MCW8198317.1 ABC transporter permease [Verminephrobacter aporrectodeae subsp. tuberculatae]MCW8204221.1 ABC transporter permease [Verminephrobacter aporrectodeae subsp. tuberculatae]